MDALFEEMYNADYKDDDCLVIFIMSHGKDGLIKTHDSQDFEIKTMIRRFSRVSSLEGKPKLFFIAACQGSEYA